MAKEKKEKLGNLILAPFRKLVLRYPNRSQRAFEILPGFVSWTMIIFPVIGSFFWPIGVAYYIIAFDIYWFYRSISVAFLSLLSWYRMRASTRYDWMGDVRGFPDWERVRHVVVIPNYKEPAHTLERTLQGLVRQTFPIEKIIPIVAFEARAGKEFNQERREYLEEKFKGKFAKIIFSEHP